MITYGNSQGIRQLGTEAETNIRESLMSNSDAAFILTVALCTYNRAAELRRTLQTLLHTTSSIGWKWELLLIDNNSHDETFKISQEFAKSLPLRYIFEPTQGLSSARNRAIEEAKSDFVVFTDDDVDVQPGWLNAYANLLERYPDIAFAGGKILPAWQEAIPGWFLQFSSTLFRGILVWYDEGDEERPYQGTQEHFYGANIGFRVKAIQAIGGFNPAFGVCGSKRGGGEEGLAIELLLKNHYQGYYIPEAIVHHRIDRARCTKTYVFRYAESNGKFAVLYGLLPPPRLFDFEIIPMPKRWFGMVPLRLSYSLLRSAMWYFLCRLTRNPTYWVPALWKFGEIFGAWREVRTERKKRISIYATGVTAE